MPTRANVAVFLASALVVSVLAQPVAGLASSVSTSGPHTLQQADDGENVSVGVGQQLSTVITATSVETESAVTADLFSQAFENASDETQARAIATRAATIESNAIELRTEFDTATAAYRDGELSTSAYAQRLATFNARANALEESATTVMDSAADVSDLELRAAGYNESALQDAVDDVESLTGVGLATVYQRFIGGVVTNLSVSATDGLAVTAEADGELTREFEREGDDDTAYALTQSRALETARESLTTPENGSWTLVETDVKFEYGTYRFEFELLGQDLSGEAEATIDGSSGDVIRFEEEIERDGEDFESDDRRTDADDDDREGDDDEQGEDDSDEEEPEDDEQEDDDHDERESDDDEQEDDGDEQEDDHDDEREAEDGEHEDDEESEMVLLVTDGTIAPNESVTVQALRDGSPASNVTIEVNDVVRGTTDVNGTLTVTLPDHETEIEWDDASLEFEFENPERETREVYKRLRTTGDISNGTITLTVEYDNESVSNATVWVNDRKAGRTDTVGTLSVDVSNETELDVEIVKGEFEAELEYAMVDGVLTLTESAHEGDGDKVDADDEMEEEHEEAEVEKEDDEDEADDEDDADESDEEDEQDGDDDEEDSETDDSDADSDTEEADESEDTEEDPADDDSETEGSDDDSDEEADTEDSEEVESDEDLE